MTSHVVIKRLEGLKADLMRDMHDLQLAYCKDTEEMILKYDGQYKTYKPDTDMHIAAQLICNPRLRGIAGRPEIRFDPEINKYVLEFVND